MTVAPIWKAGYLRCRGQAVDRLHLQRKGSPEQTLALGWIV